MILQFSVTELKIIICVSKCMYMYFISPYCADLIKYILHAYHCV